MVKRAACWAVPILLLVSACGGDDDAASDDVTDEVLDDTVAEESSDVDPATGSDGSDEVTAADGDDSDTVFSGDADSDWCVAARDIDVLVDRLDSEEFNVADPAAVEAAFSSIVTEFENARDLAPDEIADDVQTSLEGFAMLTDELEAVDWDFLDADLTVIEELDAEMDESSDRIGRYNEEVCGIAYAAADDESASADDGSFDPGAGTAREQMEVGLVELGFTAEEAACIVDNVDIAGYMDTNDDNIIVDAFDACEIPISRLVELGEG
jgi:hypothetical protein